MFNGRTEIGIPQVHIRSPNDICYILSEQTVALLTLSQRLLGALTICDVPEYALDAYRFSGRVIEWRLDYLDVDLLTAGRLVLFDRFEQLSCFNNFLVIPPVLFG